MGRVTTRVPAHIVDGTGPARRRVETVAVEEPLEIRVGEQVVTVTMRTPGDDFDLTLGHLATEGLIDGPGAVASMMHCTDVDADGSPTFNVVEATLPAGTTLARPVTARTELATGACGVCGTAAIDDVAARAAAGLAADDTRIDHDRLTAMVDGLRSQQTVFAKTGGVHAAALYSPEGNLLVTREDIGRHNAVDKVIGWAVREDRLPLTGHVLVVSSRASFEIVAKAAAAGIPILACVSAASSLAVSTADQLGITLAGFVRPPRATIYSHPRRIVDPSGAAS